MRSSTDMYGEPTVVKLMTTGEACFMMRKKGVKAPGD
jgi:hypothetical protein